VQTVLKWTLLFCIAFIAGYTPLVAADENGQALIHKETTSAPLTTSVVRHIGRGSFLKYFIPKQFAKSIYDVDFADLRQRGFNSILFDLDNTLIEPHHTNISAKCIRLLEELKGMGFHIMVVSNDSQFHSDRCCKKLCVDCIPRAMKPLKGGFCKAIEELDTTCLNTVIIGDQLFTDILGGNLMGIHTILVVPIDSNQDDFITRLLRPMERMLFRCINLPTIRVENS
jgi:HAD superfamily phosphatase (TIGR01668 family)